MGGSRRKKYRDDSSEESTSVSSSASDVSDSSTDRDRRRRRDKRRKAEKKRKRDKSELKSKRRKHEDKDYHRKKHRSSKKYRNERSPKPDLEPASPVGSTEEILIEILKEFPQVVGELTQLLQMVDNGQAVDISGISEKLLVRFLRRLFASLYLNEVNELVFLLPTNARPTLDIVEPLIKSYLDSKTSQSVDEMPIEDDHTASKLDQNLSKDYVEEIGPRRRVIGPEMPSSELLAAAATLTEAQEELSEFEENELFIGPPPPAMVAEAESANEAERFEEVTRIMEANSDSPYEIIGINQNIAVDNIKKRYWKLSLLVHPDKCSHPLAQQAFVKLNNAFKELQDPEKKKMLDDKIKAEKEQEAFRVELRAMREAAQWRKLQGISMNGDDELLAQMDPTDEKKRDEWMTSLPPERKPGTTMQASRFSKNSVEGRGDTSGWTDTPLDRLKKAKTNFLEAYDRTTAIASASETARKKSADAELVDEYNRAKRSKSMLQKHKEGANKPKKSGNKEQKKEEWVGQHPWKPWDRERDLSSSKINAKLDSDNMKQGLSTRFASGNFQRNFL